jgi:hypothetical protein
VSNDDFNLNVDEYLINKFIEFNCEKEKIKDKKTF